MPLSAAEIESSDLIQNRLDEHFGAASYDLSIGTILTAPESGATAGTSASQVVEITEAFSLAPQGMVRVISQEVVKLPQDILGYALVKNRLSNRGVLAINIGLIDPCYEGPLSSTLINFGSMPFVLEPGTAFLRLTFHRVQPNDRAEPLKLTHKSYLARTKKEVLATASQKFLNLNQLADDVERRFHGSFKKYLFRRIPMAGIVLAAITILIPLWAYLWTSYTEFYERKVDQIISSPNPPSTTNATGETVEREPSTKTADRPSPED